MTWSWLYDCVPHADVEGECWMKCLDTVLQRCSHSCGWKQVNPGSQPEDLWEQDGLRINSREKGKPGFKRKSKAYSEVAVTPFENFVFVICPSQQWRPVLRVVINCVGEKKGFKAMKMLDVCLVLERIQNLQTQNDKHFWKTWRVTRKLKSTSRTVNSKRK